MPDEQHRQNAEILIYRAQRRAKNTEEKIALYEQSLDEYSKIEHKTIEDMRNIANQCASLAIIYFNRGALNPENYHKAVFYYEASIAQIHKITETFQLEDQDFRELTKTYIDLADTFSHLFRQAAVEEAMAKAISSFLQIRNKTAAEMEIGDPAINFQKFYHYFETQTSEPTYLASAAFKNHEQIFLHRQEDAAMADLLTGCSISERELNAVSDITSMMQGLHATNTPSFSFSSVSSANPQNDVDHRSIAIEFLKLTQQHITQGNIPNTIATYQQAYRALQTIQNKNANDIATMERLVEYIQYLEMKLKESHPTQALPTQNEQVSRDLIVRMSMFNRSSDKEPDTLGTRSQFLKS